MYIIFFIFFWILFHLLSRLKQCIVAIALHSALFLPFFMAHIFILTPASREKLTLIKKYLSTTELNAETFFECGILFTPVLTLCYARVCRARIFPHRRAIPSRFFPNLIFAGNISHNIQHKRKMLAVMVFMCASVSHTMHSHCKWKNKRFLIMVTMKDERAHQCECVNVFNVTSFEILQ